MNQTTLSNDEMIALGKRVSDGYLGGFLVDYPGRTHGYDSNRFDSRTITCVEMAALMRYAHSDDAIIDDWVDRFNIWCEENIYGCDKTDSTAEPQRQDGRCAAKTVHGEGKIV